MTAEPTPPVYEQALHALDTACKQGGVTRFDPLRTPFAEVAPVVDRLLGAPFDPDNAKHKAVALGLAAMLGERLKDEHGAFWFSQREAPFGAAMGFPNLMLVLSPLDLVEAALREEGAAALDRRLDELRESVQRALADIPTGANGARLSGEQYRSLFDPEQVQLLVVDPERVGAAGAMPAASAAELLRDAIAAAAGLDPTVREELVERWVRPLEALDPARPLKEQAEREPRAIERFCRLYGALASTAPAAEAFWADVAFRLLLVEGTSAPETSPNARGTDGREALARALSSLPAQPLQGARLLGMFPLESARPLVPQAPGAPARLYAVDDADLRARLQKFNERQARPVLEGALASAADGDAAGEARELVDIAFSRLAEAAALMPRLSLGPFVLAFRRMPEAELPHDAAASAVSGALMA